MNKRWVPIALIPLTVSVLGCAGGGFNRSPVVVTMLSEAPASEPEGAVYVFAGVDPKSNRRFVAAPGSDLAKSWSAHRPIVSAEEYVAIAHLAVSGFAFDRSIDLLREKCRSLGAEGLVVVSYEYAYSLGAGKVVSVPGTSKSVESSSLIDQGVRIEAYAAAINEDLAIRRQSQQLRSK